MDDKPRGEEEKVSSVQTCSGSVTHAGDSTALVKCLASGSLLVELALHKKLHGQQPIFDVLASATGQSIGYCLSLFVFSTK